MRRALALACALTVAAGATAACARSGDSSDDDGGRDRGPTTTVERPGTTTSLAVEPATADLDAFYRPPAPLPDGEPGDVLRAMEVGAPPGAKAWRVLYRSESVAGEPIAVSALLVAPDPTPTEGPMPIFAVAHGTTGIGDQCAPSRLAGTELDAGEVEGAAAAIASDRYVVVATDYEGLGTPGVHPYAVGLSEGRSVLDSIRAAQRFPSIGTTADSPSVVWGHSQGGGAALVAAELAATYAPDANLAGAAAGAPAAELKLLATALRTSPFFGYVLMAAAGFGAAYADLDLGGVLTPAGVAAAETVAGQCASESVAAFRGKPAGDYLHADPGSTEPFASRLEENSPGVRSTSVPVFLYHGESDEQIPVVASKLVLDRYCANGSPASRKTFPGATHAGVVPLAMPDVMSFLNDRLAGRPAPRHC